MSHRDTKIGILGDGAWGTTLALLLAGKGYESVLWGVFPAYTEEMRRKRENVKFLPGFDIPPQVRPSSDLAGTVAWADWLVLVVPSQFVRGVLKRLDKAEARQKPIASFTKGIETGSLRTMSQVIHEELGPRLKLCVISGPTIAREVAQKIPAAMSLASRDKTVAREAHAIFQTDYFSLYETRDVLGVELGGSVKNVIAICAGIVEGLGFGTNTQAALANMGFGDYVTRQMAAGSLHYFDSVNVDSGIPTTSEQTYVPMMRMGANGKASIQFVPTSRISYTYRLESMPVTVSESAAPQAGARLAETRPVEEKGLSSLPVVGQLFIHPVGAENRGARLALVTPTQALSLERALTAVGMEVGAAAAREMAEAIELRVRETRLETPWQIMNLIAEQIAAHPDGASLTAGGRLAAAQIIFHYLFMNAANRRVMEAGAANEVYVVDSEPLFKDGQVSDAAARVIEPLGRSGRLAVFVYGEAQGPGHPGQGRRAEGQGYHERHCRPVRRGAALADGDGGTDLRAYGHGHARADGVPSRGRQ